MNGLSSLRAHRRTTSSGERLKDSTLSLKDSTLSLKETALSLKDSQRDSDEDSTRTNTSLSHRALHQSHRLSAYDNVAPSSLSLPTDTSTMWTSFEISLADPDESDKAEKLGPDQESSTEVNGTTNVLDHSVNISEKEDPAEQEPETNENLTNIVTDLKQELKSQKKNYETCIRK